MSRERSYTRAERIAGVVFVGALGVSLLAAALAYLASERWEIAALVGGALALGAFLGGAIAAAVLSEGNPPRR